MLKLPNPARRCLSVVLFLCWSGYAAAEDQPAPIKIAVFPFELEEFSPAEAEGSAPDVAAYLTQSTDEAKQQLSGSGAYEVVDTASADLSAAKGEDLRKCGGCEAGIANALGADLAMIGVVTKISMTEYVVKVQVSDAKSGDVVGNFSTDLRMGTADSWSRGVRSLMRNQILKPS